MRTGKTSNTPQIFVEALGFVVKECQNAEGVLCEGEKLPIWEFRYQLGGGLGLLEAEDSEIVANALLDLGVITLASEQVDNYDVQVHPDRARKILGTLEEWQ